MPQPCISTNSGLNGKFLGKVGCRRQDYCQCGVGGNDSGVMMNIWGDPNVEEKINDQLNSSWEVLIEIIAC